MQYTPWETLKALAKGASERAYCPYSKFHVGAAVLTESGEIYTGCNVENASYGLTNCAERTAIFKMVEKSTHPSDRKITAIAIYTPTKDATAPCGACRQVIREFGPNCIVTSFCQSDTQLSRRLEELLPNSFGPDNLNQGS